MAVFGCLDDICDLTSAIHGAFQSMSSSMDRLLRAKTIWIKPNITSIAHPSQGKTSSPAVLEGLLLALEQINIDFGKIRIADSSVIGTDTYEAALEAGILDICSRFDIPFVDLRTVRVVTRNIASPMVFPKLDISEPFTLSDVFKINLAKIKTSYGSPAALSVKNTKGIINDETKLAFHLRGLQDGLVDLHKVVKWDLTLLEAFPASSLGQPVAMNLLIVSDSSLIADILACELVHIPLSASKHLQYIAEQLGVSDISLVKRAGAEILQNAMPVLRYAKSAISEMEGKFGVKIIDGAPCSGCLESLAKALSRKRSWPRLKGKLAVGLQLRGDSLRDAGSFIGNCSFDGIGMALVELDYSDEILRVWQRACKAPGCPPTIDCLEEILNDPTASTREATALKTVSRFSIRKEVEERLARQQFEIVPFQLLLSADVIRRPSSAAPAEIVSFADLPPDLRLHYEMLAASICHQMSWDFLRSRLHEIALEMPAVLIGENLAQVSPSIICDLLSGYDKPGRIRATERSGMLRTLGKFLLQWGGSAEVLLKESQNKAGGRAGLYALLDQCPVFGEDPERKKSNVFVHSIVKAGLWPCVDVDELQPAIDYHIMRLYLRRGDVRIRDKVYLKALQTEAPRTARTVTRLRRIVAEALRRVAAYAETSVPVVNHFEWWVGRSVCLRDKPDCEGKNARARWLNGNPCPFRDQCVAYNENHEFFYLKEPFHRSRYY